MISALLRKPVRIDITESFDAQPENRSSGMTREQIIDRIIVLNPSATPGFLQQFDEHALEHYLNHLSLITTPRGRDTRWMRPSGQPWAFASRACA